MPAAETMIRVGKSACGRGVFARKVIRKGTQVGIARGRVFDDPLYCSNYCIDLGGDLSLEPTAPFRYLNHCCDPNCKLFLIERHNKDGTLAPSDVQVKSLRSIAVGEELTIDYAWCADAAIPCLCGADACRGWVVAATECVA